MMEANDNITGRMMATTSHLRVKCGVNRANTVNVASIMQADRAKHNQNEWMAHVFELPAKANQFSKTLEFLHQFLANTTYNSTHEMEVLFSELPSLPEVKLPLAKQPQPHQQ